MKKHTFEEVKKYFEDAGCELLQNTYENVRNNVKYRCKCGEESKTSFSNFKRGHRCIECAGKKKHDIEDVKQYFLDFGCELLESSYKNNTTSMKYICKCGEESKTSFSNFKRGHRCIECAGKKKYDFEYVKEYFLDAGCELLETEYKNNNTSMKYICSCGDASSTSFTGFKRGARCRLCSYDKAAKSSYNFKDYTCPDGTVVKCQGYEHLALDELYASYDQADIENSRRNIPVINYEFEGKTRRYFPDIFIKSKNKIVEVKSYYIYNLQLDRNIVKKDATKRAGFDYEVWIYVSKKKGTFDKHII